MLPFCRKMRGLRLKLKIIRACKCKDLELRVTEELIFPCNVRDPLHIPLRRNTKKMLCFSTLCRNFLAHSSKCNLLVNYFMLGITQVLQLRMVFVSGGGETQRQWIVSMMVMAVQCDEVMEVIGQSNSKNCEK